MAQLGGGLTDHDRDEGRFSRPVAAHQPDLLPRPDDERGVRDQYPIADFDGEGGANDHVPLYEPAQGLDTLRRCPAKSPLVLQGRFVRLEPLSEAHIDPLVAAASEDRSNYQWSTAPNGRAQTERYVNEAIAKVRAW